MQLANRRVLNESGNAICIDTHRKAKMNIQTERTYLRYFNDSDSNDLFDYLSKKEIYQYEPGSPVSFTDAVRIAHERSQEKNFIAVVDKQTGHLLGHFSFFQTEPSYVNTYELGFIFNPSHQGKGFATEAGKALIQHCFYELKIHRIISNCNPENAKSWRLLERLGFTREGLLKENIYFYKVGDRPNWVNTYVYGLVNPND